MREQGRELRMAELVREQLAGIIQLEMRDPRIGLVSVNDVRVTKDFAFADVYVSTMAADAAAEPTAEQKATLVEVLNGASGFLRSALAKRHQMRGTPKPRFFYDESLARGRRLEALIDRATAADRRNAADARPEVQHGR